LELAVIIICVLIIVAILLYFFSIAFVRKRGKDIENFENAVKRSLKPYKEQIKEGIDYINSLECEEVYIKSFDGLSLFGRFYNSENARGTIILFHGYRSFAKRDFSCAVKMYIKWGLNVLLVDQRAHGRSEGRLITFGIKERFDAVSWINYVIEERGKSEQILLGGMSMGATTVLLCSGFELPQNVKGIIADSGFTSPVDIIKKVAKDNYNVGGALVLPIFNFFCKLFGRFSLYGVSTKDAVKKSKVPILLIHGKADNFVPCDMCCENYKCALCEKDILLVENAGHGLGFFFNKDAMRQKAFKFIEKNIA